MGSSGCGKSHVINGVAAFAAAWGRPDAVVLTATTGAAAKNIRNCTTIDSELNMDREFDEQTKKFSHQDNLRWKRVKLFFVDECSMLNLKMLRIISSRLSDATMMSGEFGDIPAVVFCGDYHQMPPVGNYPLYRRFSEAEILEKPSRRSDNEAAGLYE